MDANDKYKLKRFEQNVHELREAFHLHACRAGPLNANEIYLSICENKFRPGLRLIKGVTQPKGIVAKHLFYWTSGIHTSLIDVLLDNLVLSGERIYSNGSYNSDVLCSPCDELQVSKDNLLQSVVAPILEHYGPQVRDLKLPQITLNSISESLGDSAMLDFQTGLRQISITIINTLLRSRNLPTYTIEELEDIDLIKTKSVNESLLKESYSHLIEKKINRYRTAFGVIRNELKTYNGQNPSKIQIEKILKRSRHKIPCFEGLSIDESTVINLINMPHLHPKLSLREVLEVAMQSRITAVHDYNSGETVHMNGRDMIETIFNVAARRDEAVILQEFERPDTYEIYEKNRIQHPELTILAPVCTTWRLDEFPHFDKNIFSALNYLAL